nr:MAG TPA: minor tail protein [Caudoviricetes sp.]
MSETLHKLQVVIEGNSSKLTQATREAMQETRRMTSGINAELKKISSPFAGMKSNPAREITRGIRDMMKQMQVAAGMKVYTDDYKKVCKDISDTEKELDKLQGKMAGMEGKEFVPTQEFKDLEKNIQKSSSALEKLNSQKVKMEQAGKDTVPTEDYTAVTNQMTEAQNRLSALKTQAEKFGGIEINDYDDYAGTKALMADIRETEKEIFYLKGELKNLQDTGGASRQTDAYRDLTGEITRTEKKLQEYKDLRSSMLLDGSNLEESEAFRKNELAIQDATKRLREYNAEKVSMEKSGSDVKLSGQWKNAATGILSKSFAGMKSTLGQVTAGIKTAGGAFASLIHRFRNGIPVFSRVKNAAGGLGGAFKTLGITAKFMLASFLISNSVRGAADGFKNLAKYSSSTNAELSSLMNSLNLLKNSLASAFSPVLSAIAPALETLINYCVNAINAIGQLFAALTGQGTYYKAVKGNQDFAAGLSKSADKANNSAKALKNTLMGFDEINKLDDDSGSGGSGGSGGGGSAGSFDMVPVENAYADFAKRIKDAWAKADFTELGGIFGTKIRDALNSIPWDEIKETAQKVGKSLATFINGAVEVSGLADAVGNTVAQALNTGVLGADSFMKNLHWDSVGQFVADSMNSFVKKADWKGIGTAVKDGINGVITAKATWAGAFDFKAAGEAVKTAVKNALTGIKWTQANTGAASLGKGIATALNSIMTTDTFSLIGKSAAGAVNTVISGAYAFIGTINFKGWGKSIATGINSYFENVNWTKAGLSFSKAVNGILDTLLEALSGTNWQKVGQSIGDFIANINWGSALNKIGQIVWEVIKGAITAAIEAAKKDPKIVVDLSALLVFKFVSDAIFSTIASTIVKKVGEGIAASAAALTGLAETVMTPLGIIIGGGALAAFNVWAKEQMGTDEALIEGVQNFFTSLGKGFESFAQSSKVQSFVTSANSAIKKALNFLGIDIPINAQDKTEEGVNSANTKLSTINDQETAEIEANDNTEPGVTSAKKGLSEIPKEKEVTLKLNKGDFGGGGRDFSIGVEAKVTTPASTLRQSILDGWNSLGTTTVGLGTSLLNGSTSKFKNSVQNNWNTSGGTSVSVGTRLKDGSSGDLRDSVANGWKGLKDPPVLSVGARLKGGTSGDLRDSVANGWKSLKKPPVLSVGTRLKYGSTDALKKSVLNNWSVPKVGVGIDVSTSGQTLWDKTKSLWDNYTANKSLYAKVNPTVANWSFNQNASGGLYTSGQWRPITAAASGGAFSTGQMFIAREAGPELVGSIGRSTAVMNNTQIVSSVAAGVYSAVVSAFSQYAAQNSQSGTANINVYVGGKQVTDVVIEEVNRRTSANGVCPIRT